MTSKNYRLSNDKSFSDVSWKDNTKTKGGRLTYTTQVTSQYILISFHFLILKILRKKSAVLISSGGSQCYLLCFLIGVMEKYVTQNCRTLWEWNIQVSVILSILIHPWPVWYNLLHYRQIRVVQKSQKGLLMEVSLLVFLIFLGCAG